MSVDPNRAPLLYLASQSPRRGQLLEQLGVAYQLLLPDADENAEALEAELPGEAALAYVQRVTGHKLDAALARRERRGWPAAPVLAADTTVTLDGRILGKPADADEALAMLTLLSGRSHQVLTAVALGWGAGQRAERLSLSSVTLAALTPDVLRRYVASGEPFGKAGAYAVQGRMAAWIERIEGSYSGIMGLPLFETAALLRQAGIDL